MSVQQVVFITDFELKSQQLFSQLRLCIYELRQAAFKQNEQIEVAFCHLAAGTSSASISFFDLDNFAFSKENQEKLFQAFSKDDLKNYLESIKTENGNYSPKIIHITKDSSSSFMQDLSLSLLIKEKKVSLKEISEAEIADLAEKSKSILNKKSNGIKPLISKKIIGIAVAACLGIALISSIPFLIQKTEFKRFSYQKVYTGDGDRLILRMEPDLQADEIIRMNEGECVQLIEKGEIWNHVNYHGLSGYCHNEYLVEAVADEYVITNPDSKYTYGKACVKFLEPTQVDGYEWINQAAEDGLIRAQWALYGYYDKGTDRIKKDTNTSSFWLGQVYSNQKCYEDSEIDECRRIATNHSEDGNEKLAKKFNDKAKDRERNVKEIRQQAAKKLSQLYFESDIKAASDYYKKAIELGIKFDQQYVYDFVKNNRLKLKDKIYWTDKASEKGYGKHAYTLATEFMSNYELGFSTVDDYDVGKEAANYYAKAYNNGYNKSECAYKTGKYYFDKNNYSKAYDWFLRCHNQFEYTSDFYLANYYLGYLSENGLGVSRNIYSAMGYYREAYYKIDAAKQAYNRLYNQYYGGW